MAVVVEAIANVVRSACRRYLERTRLSKITDQGGKFNVPIGAHARGFIAGGSEADGPFRGRVGRRIAAPSGQRS